MANNTKEVLFDLESVDGFSRASNSVPEDDSHTFEPADDDEQELKEEGLQKLYEDDAKERACFSRRCLSSLSNDLEDHPVNSLRCTYQQEPNSLARGKCRAEHGDASLLQEFNSKNRLTRINRMVKEESRANNLVDKTADTKMEVILCPAPANPSDESATRSKLTTKLGQIFSKPSQRK